MCGSSGVTGGIGLSEYSLPARVRILGRWQMHSQALLPSFTNNPVPRHARSTLHQYIVVSKVGTGYIVVSKVGTGYIVVSKVGTGYIVVSKVGTGYI